MKERRIELALVPPFFSFKEKTEEGMKNEVKLKSMATNMRLRVVVVK